MARSYVIEVLIYSIRLTNFSDILDFHDYLLIGIGLNETLIVVPLYFDFLMVLWFASTGEHPKAIRWLLFVIVMESFMSCGPLPQTPQWLH